MVLVMTQIMESRKHKVWVHMDPYGSTGPTSCSSYTVITVALAGLKKKDFNSFRAFRVIIVLNYL